MSKIRILTFGLMLLILVFGPLASAQELTKEAKIERILTLMKADTMMDQMLNQMKSFAVSQLPSETSPQQQERFQLTTSKMMDVFRTFVERLRPHQIKAYNDAFSNEEIDGLLAFLESPGGHAWIDKMPLIGTQTMIAMQEEMKGLQSEIERIVKEGNQP